MTIHQNLIAGEWVGTEATDNINPSDTADVVGRYAAEFFTTVKTAYTMA